MKNYFLITILAAFVLSSCGEWLNLEPEDGVIRERYWKTKEEARSAVNGCYASLMEDGMMLNYFIWGEIRADFCEPTARANEDVLDMRDGEITSSNRYTSWDLAYRTINQCNTVIELAPRVLAVDMSFSEKLLRQYQAEATCIRSLAYFYLLRTFRDVPYVTKASIYDDQNYVIPKTQQSAIEDSLVAALRAVENDLPFTYDSQAESKGRFTAWGLKALLADIYLWKGDYRNCIDLCTQIINSGQFSLVSVPREALKVDASVSPTGKDEFTYHADKGAIVKMFDEVYVKGSSVESIFELQFSQDKNNPFAQWFQPGSPYLQQNINVPTEFFLTSMIDRAWYDVRGSGYAYTSGGAIWKWVGLEAGNASNYRAINESHCNWIFYRLAEIYLMKAEALTQQALEESGNQAKLVEAHELLKVIRERGNATEATDLFFSNTEEQELDGITMEEFILAERARELSYEGKRWFDVLRHARRNNYAERNLNYMLKMAMYSASPEKISTLQNKWSTKITVDGKNLYGSHYLPINLAQIKANKALVQNEFYKDNAK
jgi:hypothetical protein